MQTEKAYAIVSHMVESKTDYKKEWGLGELIPTGNEEFPFVDISEPISFSEMDLAKWILDIDYHYEPSFSVDEEKRITKIVSSRCLRTTWTITYL